MDSPEIAETAGTANGSGKRTSLKRLVQSAAHLVGVEITKRKITEPVDPDFVLDADEQTAATIKAVRPFTLTSAVKIAGLCDAVRFIVKHNVPGDLVECGVWRGGSMMAAARTLMSLGDTSRHLYLYDTFEGMSEPGANDLRFDGTLPEEMMKSVVGKDATMQMWCRATIEDVAQSIATVGYPEDKIHLVKGKVEETIPDVAPATIAILRLDTDWYESTMHELIHLFPNLSHSGVLIIDDYGFWLGARKAVDEYFAESDARVLLSRLDDGRIGVLL